MYNVLHIGDMIVSVAGVTPNSAAEIREIARASTATRVGISIFIIVGFNENNVVVVVRSSR